MNSINSAYLSKLKEAKTEERLNFKDKFPTNDFQGIIYAGKLREACECTKCNEIIPLTSIQTHLDEHSNNPIADDVEVFLFNYKLMEIEFPHIFPGNNLDNVVKNISRKKKVRSPRTSNHLKILEMTKFWPSNYEGIAFKERDCSDKKRFRNIETTNLERIDSWARLISNDKTILLKIEWPLLKNIDKKAKRRSGLSWITNNVRNVLSGRTRNQAKLSVAERNCERKLAKMTMRYNNLKKRCDEDGVMIESDENANDDVNDEDFDIPNVLEINPWRTDSKTVGDKDTFYNEVGRNLLAKKKTGFIFEANPLLYKVALQLMIRNQISASQIGSTIATLRSLTGVYPIGDDLSSSFFVKSRKILPEINRFVIKDKLNKAESLVMFFDGSPTLRGYNLINYGFIDQNTDSFLLNICQFEYRRTSSVSKGELEANLIIDNLNGVCQKENLEMEVISRKIIGVLSDNAPAAKKTCKEFLAILHRKFPLDPSSSEDKRKRLPCGVHGVALLEVFCCKSRSNDKKRIEVKEFLVKLSGFMGNINGSETAAEPWIQKYSKKYKFLYVRGSRWGILIFNASIAFLKRKELIQFLKERKNNPSLVATSNQLIENLKSEKKIDDLAILSFSWISFKIIWKNLIKKVF